ncbi:MAG: O-antigen ligase family protein [Pseudomonadota bacterium]
MVSADPSKDGEHPSNVSIADWRDRLSRLAWDCGVISLIVMPIAMVPSRGIAPTCLAVTLSFFGIAAVLAGDLVPLLRSWLAQCRYPISLIAFAFLGYQSVTLMWTPAPWRGAQLLLHIALVVLCMVDGIGALKVRRNPARVGTKALSLCLAAAAILVFVEVHFGSPLRSLFTDSLEPFRLNRAAIGIALLLPFAVFPLMRSGQLFLAFALVCLCVIAIFRSDSESAKLAVMMMAVVAGAQLLSERFARHALAAAIILTLLTIPLIAPHVNALFPAEIHDLVGHGAMYQRGLIWAAFADLVPNALWFGHGLEASFAANEALAPNIPPELRSPLANDHPHNAALQLWFELGLVGVAFVLAALLLLFNLLGRIHRSLRDPLVLFIAAAWAVTFVSHGAWQAWWWCLVGGVALYAFSSGLSRSQTDTSMGQ